MYYTAIVYRITLAHQPTEEQQQLLQQQQQLLQQQQQQQQLQQQQHLTLTSSLQLDFNNFLLCVCKSLLPRTTEYFPRNLIIPCVAFENCYSLELLIYVRDITLSWSLVIPREYFWKSVLPRSLNIFSTSVGHYTVQKHVPFREAQQLVRTRYTANNITRSIIFSCIHNIG